MIRSKRSSAVVWSNTGSSRCLKTWGRKKGEIADLLKRVFVWNLWTRGIGEVGGDKEKTNFKFSREKSKI